jgi:hypothetical protein
MHTQTRKLLKLLADETVDAIIDELRKGARTEAQLVMLSPSDRRTTARRLEDLRDLEVVSFEKGRPTGKSGRRPRLFKVVEPLLFDFCEKADSFALALSEKQTESLRRHISGSR